MLEIRNLRAGYPGRQILSGVDLSAPEGSLTVIVGPNGCGKTTLLKALAGLIPCSGEVRFRGTELHALPPRERAKLLSFLPQNRPVPELTAEKLVLHGRFPYLSYPRHYRPEDTQAAREALERLGIASLSGRYLSTLSGGERQKVYIAMLLAQGAGLMLMDEPTASLDLAHKYELLRTARELAAQGYTVVMVLHELDLAMNYAHRIAVMENGRILRCADPETLFRENLSRSLFGAEMGRLQTGEDVRYYLLPPALD